MKTNYMTNTYAGKDFEEEYTGIGELSPISISKLYFY